MLYFPSLLKETLHIIHYQSYWIILYTSNTLLPGPLTSFSGQMTTEMPDSHTKEVPLTRNGLFLFFLSSYGLNLKLSHQKGHITTAALAVFLGIAT